MKKTISILILGIFILSSTEIHQLIKLPVLIHHFIEHKRFDSKISFFSFLEMHYAENNKHNSKEHRHEKLPFKSHTCCVNHLVIAEIHFFMAVLPLHVYSSRKEAIKFKEGFYSSSLQCAIWQPPKIC